MSMLPPLRSADRPRRPVGLLTTGFAVLVAALTLQPASNTRAGSPRRTAVVDVVERVRGAVVNIHSERTVKGPATEELFALAPSQNRINGMGTGILIDPRGYIVTNQHVVDDVNVIRIRLADGSTYTGQVIARDQESDLALLKIDADHLLPTMPLGTVKDLMVGETVIAIGNAYGYEHTVTVGVVSALKRDVTLNKEISYKSLIQTDASINPGNSGGPLLNIDGQMIGVNVAIRAGAQGISFAIPVDTMIQVVSDMMSVRKRAGLTHGLIYHNKLSTAPATRDGQSDGLVRSLVVDRVEPNGPAAHAGFEPGDVIVRAADVRVAGSLDLERAFLGHPAGERIPVIVRRNKTEQRLELVLESAERESPGTADTIWQKLGVRLRPVGRDAVVHASAQLQGGLAIVEINPDGVAAKAGVQRGDILIGLHQWKTQTLDNVLFVLTHRDLPTFNPLAFYIIRNGQVHRGWMQQVE